MAKGRLAQRLRALRTRGWPGRRVTQVALGQALDVSPALISSWENEENPTIPPTYRLEAYATFFATERSVESEPYRVLTELTEDERARRDELLAELMRLGDDDAPGATSPFEGTLWHFPSDEEVTIVCSELPQERLERMPYTDPDKPDYVELYQYADLDALLEIFGHIRAVNPTLHVHVRVGTRMVPDEYTDHLVLLGGVDWNPVTEATLAEIELPVRQLARQDDSAPGGFEVGEGEQREVVAPVLGKQNVLKEDVAHFYRSVNPFNKKRTVTICNGTYQRGTLGAVRALTDEGFRDRNDQYIRSRFAGANTFSIISRVRVVNGVVITPDWTKAGNRLHEWPVEPRAGH